MYTHTLQNNDAKLISAQMNVCVCVCLMCGEYTEIYS